MDETGNDDPEDLSKMKEYQEVLRKVLGAFQDVSFPVIVESSTNFRVIPVDERKDKDLLDDLSDIADALAKKHHSDPIMRADYKKVVGTDPKSFRPNEAGRVVEYEMGQFPGRTRTITGIAPLKGSGYPDLRIETGAGRVAYVDIKATTRWDVGSPRDFYYSTKEKTIEKIRGDGYHLLLGFVIRERKAEEYTTLGWKLSDLSKIRVSMKAEFNADNLEIYKKSAIIREHWVEKPGLDRF